MSSKPHPLLGLLVGLTLTGLAGLTGAVLGGLYVRFFVPKTGMGWDQIADTLGGLMLGGLIGLVIGAVLAFRLTPRRRLAVTALMAASFAVLALGLAVTRPQREPSAPLPPQSEPSRDELRSLIPLVEAAAEEAALGHCRTTADDLNSSLNIKLDGVASKASVQAGCFEERPAMMQLAEAIDSLADGHCTG